MKTTTIIVALAAGLLALVPSFDARADYETNPELRPENRCAMIPAGINDPKDPGGVNSIHCQRLFWDLPATTKVGAIRVAAPFAEDRVPRFPNGLTDRIPPMYILDANGDGASDDGKGYEKAGTGRRRVCADIDQIPYWKELLNSDGSPKTGTDGLGRHSVDEPAKPQTGPLFQLACRRGSRTYFGPWQTGTDVNVFDRCYNCGSPYRSTRFENTDRLNRDVASGRTTENRRVEWNVGSEYYNHFASHHGTCYNGSDSICSNPENPQTRAAFQPGGACWNNQKGANGPSDPGGKGGCWSGDRNPTASGCAPANGYRNATQYPGRLYTPLPDGRGVLGVEDQIWGCNHHVVTQLPPGSYGVTTLANFRLQKAGLVNNTTTPVYGVPPGQPIGGSVGEMIIQYFTEPANAPVKPINFMFNAIGDLATTAYPPFTWNYHEAEWAAPTDLAMSFMVIHSHHRMVKGTMNVVPPAKPRLNSPDPICGGMKGGQTPTDLYTDWYWEDPPVCQYWKDPDGAVIIRKGQSVRTTCYVNNGVTPEAIKNGLVAGSVAEGLRSLGAPIPQQPSTVPTSAWSSLLVDSVPGQELLYGKHPPVNYRVKYTCSASGTGGSANVPAAVPAVGGTTVLVNAPFLSSTGVVGAKPCSPNPAVDGDADYVDGPYINSAQCGEGVWCNPGTITFACIGEEEMCIGVGAWYPLPRLGGAGNDEAMENLQKQDIDHVGTPGQVPPADNGICHDCGPAL
jgi:hypothetical protein